MQPMLPIEKADVFFDGVFSEPRLSHPEGIAVDGEGNVWCGSERGEIFRILSDGSEIELVASTGGFILGLAFDSHENLFACDLRYRAVFRLDAETKMLERFAPRGEDAQMNSPNFPVVDVARDCLYVSDSYSPGEEGPGVWRFDLASGEGGPWYDRSMVFANGMCLSPDGDSLFVIESFAGKVSRLPINEDGSPGEPETYAEGLERIPDGLACDADGNLFVSCYEPSRLYRIDTNGEVSLFIDDPEAHTFCHPTNCAFRGEELLTSNLGRWHVTRIEAGVRGKPLP